MAVSARTPKVIGYQRVSTTEQAGSGLGLDAQEAAIRATAARLQLPLAGMFVDAGVSGGLPLEKRPGLLAALDALGKGDLLVVAKRDRLGRDVLNVAMLERLTERKGARIVSTAGEGTEADDPTSRLMRQIVDSFAEYERAIIRARTRAALAVKKGRGERAGTIPFGFRLSASQKRLEPEPDEQHVLAVIRTLRASGTPLRAIAANLNDRGLTTRRGTAWRHQYVAAALRGSMLSKQAA